MQTTVRREGGAKKYEELEAQWRQRIQEGTWQPGERLPTFADLCSLHKVSRTTLEKVCRSLEQDGLIVRRQGSGTYIAELKPAVPTGFIGFSSFGMQLRPQLRYWTQLQDGIQEVAAREKKGVVLVDYETFDGWDKVDGLLLSDTSSEQSQRLLQTLPDRFPRVSLLFTDQGATSVVADDYQGGLIAAEHLLELGHRKIACLMDNDHPLTKRRGDGYRDALRAAGIEPDPRWVRPYSTPDFPTPHFIDRGAELMRAWLEQDWHELGCTALLAQNDLIAIGVMRALQTAGLSVPEQVSVIGFDNVEICDYVSPRLTSVEVPLHQIGATATEILLRQIDTGHRGTGSTTVLPVQLRDRESTMAPPTASKRVLQA